jgi:hypothetical protein
MKKIVLLAITGLFCLSLSAQDTIVKSNGDLISAKITEITGTEIKYKKFDFQDGPTYSEWKSNIKMIKYSNGLKEEFKDQPQINNNQNENNQNNSDYYGGSVAAPAPTNTIEAHGMYYKYQNRRMRERDIHDVLMQTKDKKIIGLVQEAKDAKGLQFIGFAAIPFGVGVFYFLTRSLLSSSTYPQHSGPTTSDFTFSGICLVGAIACPIASGIFQHKRNMSNREAIRLYNEKY